MKKSIFLLICSVLILSLGCQKASDSKRKIKLSDQTTTTRTDEQLTTTIHLEPTLRRAVAVMFFDNQTGDQNLEWLQKGLTEMFIRALSQSRSLSVLSTDRLYEIFERLDKTVSPEEMNMDMAAVVAKEANVEALLTGNISKSGDSLKISVKVHGPNQGRILKEESIEGSGMENIFGMVDVLTQKIKNDLHLSLEKDEPSRGIAELSTNSLEAWRYYTTGVDLHNKFLYTDAIPQFEKAIAIDSTFVSAYIDLIRTYGSEYNIQKTMQLFEKLRTLKDLATDRERYKIDVYEAGSASNVQGMIDIYKKWLQQFPDDIEANFDLATLYINLTNYQNCIQHYERILKIDPKHKLAINQLGYAYAYLGDFSRAIVLLNKYKKMVADEPNPYDSIGEIYLFMGEFKKAEKQLKKALKINEDFTHAWQHLMDLYLDRGDYTKALKTSKRYIETVTDGVRKANAYSDRALIYQRLGKTDQAITNYQKSLENNIFQNRAAEQIAQIHLDNNDSLKAYQTLTQNYDRIKESLTSNIRRTNFVPVLFNLSLWHEIEIEETIDMLNDMITHSDSHAQIMQAKFFLTLLYMKTQQIEKINALWTEHIPSELITTFKEIGTIGYDNLLKYFTFLNHNDDKQSDQDMLNYEEIIKHALDDELKILEMGFRLLSADSYFQEGDKENGERQLQLVGTPKKETWMVIGPFDNKNGFQKKYPPEKKIALNKIYKTTSQKITWQHPVGEIQDGFINFRQIYKQSNLLVAYGLIYLLSPDDKNVQIRIGSDEAVKIWHNDGEVWKFNKSRPAFIDDDIFNVILKKGINKILVKVCNRWGNWGFYFRITDDQGNGIPDIHFVSPDALEENA